MQGGDSSVKARNANKKRHGRSLDGAKVHGYDGCGMTKSLVFAALVALVAGCSSDTATVLDNKQFMAETSGVTATDATTNETDNAGETNQVDAATAKPRVIAPGMVISIMVDEDRSLNRQVLVPNGGAIDYAPLGRLVVEGLSTDELAANIKAALEKDYFQTATVHCAIETGTTTASGSCVIYVIGNVGRPGPLLLPPNESFTVTKAIIAAGNIAQFGNGAAVQLIRYGPNGRKYKTLVDVDRIMKRGEFEKDVPLQCGDWIIVPEKLINF